MDESRAFPPSLLFRRISRATTTFSALVGFHDILLLLLASWVLLDTLRSHSSSWYCLSAVVGLHS